MSAILAAQQLQKTFAGFFQIIHGMADWVHAAGLATGLLAASLLMLTRRRWRWLPQRSSE